MLRIHDLYGQSFAHEFQFTNPDSIKNAVKRYNMQRAAERDENKKDKDNQKMSKPRFCKMRNTGNDVLSMVKSRDLDVETQMSLRAKQLTSGGQGDHSSGSGSGSSSGTELMAKPNILRLAGGADTMTPTRSTTRGGKKVSGRRTKRVAAAPQFDDFDVYTSQIEGLHREVCAELKQISRPHSEIRIGSPKRRGNQRRFQKKPPALPLVQPLPEIRAEPAQVKCQQQQQQQQQQQEQQQQPPMAAMKQSEQDMILQRLKQVLTEAQEEQTTVYEDAYMREQAQAQAQWADLVPTPMLPDADADADAEAEAELVAVPEAEQNKTYETLLESFPTECVYMEQGVPCQQQETPEVFFAEDSDLEQEYADRPGYMRYIDRLPLTLSEPELTGGGNNALSSPCFVELEPHPNWISLQRSLKPMLYTSQRSDSDSSTLCDPNEQKKCPSKKKTETGAGATGAAGQQPVPRKRPRPSPRKNKPIVANVKVPNPAARSGQPAKRKQLREGSGAAKASGPGIGRQPGGREKEQAANSPRVQAEQAIALPAKPSVTMIPPGSPVNSPRRRKPRTVVCTRSLENLKYQKMSIYNKISTTQERIINALDRLQSSLLQLPLITSNQDKSRRERNAFNFCVRFSRNFLYPLRGMIEDVRCTPVACFNSTASNEASQRVVSVYGLMHHSLGRYQRQVRYFLLNKVPQKLSALIEMMYTLTNVCLDKGVLDRQDPVVECLQQRCTSFLSFIEDMQEQRFLLARESYRRMQRRGHGHGPGHGVGHAVIRGPVRQQRPDMHERYDLKMFLNDLKLYEPRLVPKERTEKQRPRFWLRKPKLAPAPLGMQTPQANPLSQPAEVTMDPVAEEVPTHIECVQCGGHRDDASSESDEPNEAQKKQLGNILALIQQPGREKRELHQQLLEAMEHVTKSQVREVLDPLVRSLGAMLDKKQLTDDTQ